MNLRVAIWVALKTFGEIYRERVFYNIFLLALFLLFVGYMASLLVFGHQDRVMLHFGTSAISLSMLAMAATFGARLIRNEWEQRWIYVFLSRPISRWDYFLGKLSGIGLFLLANLTVLTLVLLVGVHLAGGPWFQVLVSWMFFTWLEALLILVLAALLANGLRPGLTAMSVLAFVFLSHNHDQMATLEQKDGSNWVSLFRWLTPDGGKFLLDTRVYYEYPLSVAEWVARTTYGGVWIAVLFFLGGYWFSRRNL